MLQREVEEAEALESLLAPGSAAEIPKAKISLSRGPQ
jgi:hypothetical protein